MHTFGTRSADAPAKINLGLRILRKRDDGFHQLETGMVAIELADRITVGRAKKLSMSCSDPTLPVDQNNLCMKVALMLREVFSIDDGVHIHLEKWIPQAAGLGGGSSDAATTLQLLADLWSLDVTNDLLMSISSTLGSDIPFFISSEAVVATGRGTDLSALMLPDSVSSLWIGMVHPNIHVSTAAAYSGCMTHDGSDMPIAQILTEVAPTDWTDVLVNDFETTVFGEYPVLADIKRSLYSNGALYASMSGSGSSIFGLFKTRPSAVRAVASLHLRNWCGQMIV